LDRCRIGGKHMKRPENLSHLSRLSRHLSRCNAVECGDLQDTVTPWHQFCESSQEKNKQIYRKTPGNRCHGLSRCHGPYPAVPALFETNARTHWSWFTVHCLFCGRLHRHGHHRTWQDPYIALGTGRRVSHCGLGRGKEYTLVPVGVPAVYKQQQQRREVVYA